MTKPALKSIVYWLTTENNLLTNTIALNTVPLIHVHKGEVTEILNNVVKIKCFVNKDFIDNFEGIITGVKYLPCKKGHFQEAIIGMPLSQLYLTDAEVKMKMIEMIISNNFDL